MASFFGEVVTGSYRLEHTCWKSYSQLNIYYSTSSFPLKVHWWWGRGLGGVFQGQWICVNWAGGEEWLWTCDINQYWYLLMSEEMLKEVYMSGQQGGGSSYFCWGWGRLNLCPHALRRWEGRVGGRGCDQGGGEGGGRGGERSSAWCHCGAGQEECWAGRLVGSC